MYNIMYETSCQSRFDARFWMLGASALGLPRGMVWGGRREEGSWEINGETVETVADFILGGSKITAQPGGLLSMGLHRVGHN